MTGVQTARLETLAGGAIPELFEAELERVLANIADINTDPAQKRSITLTVTFKPGAKRETADVQVKCGSKTAAMLTVNTQLFMGRYGGKLVAVENDPRQGGLFDQEQAPKLAAVSPHQPKQPAKDGQK
jgi:hypothetical protein